MKYFKKLKNPVYVLKKSVAPPKQEIKYNTEKI
jgi:hypothetical protein